ncbi:Pyridoxal phosphate-dependent transferase, major domain protein [Cordyceps fumosorosea ARSEF 2679]|uniref:Pyridoxal phosphate-dependent transferase, major domain protein n=1 Tax=Cordyceps fumosorosea (strain ARSEF 2679) TaxID=1081104 RepID=A0A162MSR5_CORFA|nr:Pyridoxal phosphate-dependent transferase, major domain protein [Cordyceps fumosorosea ARSEF 2679]OAA69729.1 Pyridoxal phosphate-dependent transferase, major domain protein [Cordyceps fumosorosea ARSEF 2679]
MAGDASTPQGDALPTRGKYLEFGGELKKLFPQSQDWVNLNHGSYGTMPLAVREKFRAYQDLSEAAPDKYIRYDQGLLIDEARAAVSALVRAPPDTLVFVTNATEAVNTVLRNLQWNPDGKDVILFFSTIYPACAKAADFLVDYFGPDRVSVHEIPLTYPLEDEDILRLFRQAVADVERQGKRARVCAFDVVSSNPGVVFPWVALTEVCAELGVLSLVDGAQGVGMVPLDLAAADPDFFTSNCHKWLHSPRGCALLYVPARNQHLVTTTLATSHGYVPRAAVRREVLPPNAKPAFVRGFELVATKDRSQDIVTKDAIAWRRDACGGEERIMAYLWGLNKKGSEYVAGELGTEVLENGRGTLTNCAMGNVALPIWFVKGEGEADKGAKEGDVVLPGEDAGLVRQWIMEKMKDEYRTLMPLFEMGGRMWVRISAQIYLDMKDYEYAAKVLKELVARVSNGEYKN